MNRSLGFKIIDFLFQAMAVKQYLVFTGCFFFLTALVMFILDAQLMPEGCTGVQGLEFAFSTTGFMNIMDSVCGDDGARAIQIMLWVDTLLAVSYIGFFGNLLGALVRHLEYEKALFFFSIPIYAGAMNLFENTLLLVQLSNTDIVNSALIFIVAIAAVVKYILLAATIALIIYFLYAQFVKKSPA